LRIHDDHLALADKWIEQDRPILINVIRIQDEYHVMFFLRHLKNAFAWSKQIYKCRGKSVDTKAAIIPNNIKCQVNLIVKCPAMIMDQDNSTQQALEFVSIHPNRTRVNSRERTKSAHYNVKSLVTCDEISLQQEPPRPNTARVGMCTSIRGHNVRRAVDQWVEYHRLIGVDHFWIYINEDWHAASTVLLPERPYVTYIPFNFTLCNHPNKLGKEEKFRCDKDRPIVQQAVIHDCIYRSKQLGLEWIATPDVDEYIHVVDTNSTNIYNTATKQPRQQQQQEPLLLHFLNTLYPTQEDRDKIGGLVMKSIPFGRNRRLDPPNKTYPLLLDYVYRKQGNLSDHNVFSHDRQKVIMNPNTVKYVTVHNINVGGPMVRLSASTQVHLQHYKNPYKGPFRSSNYSIILDDRLSRKFRDRVMERVVDKNFSGYIYSN
jgi:hypothetical protein